MESSRSQVRVRHAFPGRIRVKVPAFPKHPQELVLVKKRLQTLHRSVGIEWRPRTGSLILTHDPKGVSGDRILATLANSLPERKNNGASRFVVFPSRTPEKKPHRTRGRNDRHVPRVAVLHAAGVTVFLGYCSVATFRMEASAFPEALEPIGCCLCPRRYPLGRQGLERPPRRSENRPVPFPYRGLRPCDFPGRVSDSPRDPLGSGSEPALGSVRRRSGPESDSRYSPSRT